MMILGSVAPLFIFFSKRCLLVKLFISCSTTFGPVMMPLQLLHILAIFFYIALQFLVAQASLDSSKFAIQEGSSEQLYSHKSAKSIQEFMDEKMRLGSTPPSCRNKCNTCNPCIAIQVPTLPNHDQVHLASQDHPSPAMETGRNKQYSNYKPVGWKCKCRNHLFNP